LIIVKLMGGLGNQMFQYAAGLSLATRWNTELRLDLTFLLDRTPRPDFTFRNYNLDIFPLKVSTATPKQITLFHSRPSKVNAVGKWFRRFGYPVRYGEKSTDFDPDFESLGRNTYLDGYWQSALYFRNVTTLVREKFHMADSVLDKEGLAFLKLIEKEESVCLHVRRGDYVTSVKTQEVLGLMDSAYYQRAVEKMAASVAQAHFFIFSDDPEWCAKNLKLESPHTFISGKWPGGNMQAEFMLMSRCKHFIIPNSTFGWWAAWLGRGEEKIVIAPLKWFSAPHMSSRDLVPREWTRI